MSKSNQADIDSLLADYSERVAKYGLNSQQEKQFYEDHSSDGDFVELAGVLRHLRVSPPRIHSTDVSVVPAQSHVRLGPLGLGLVILSLIVSTTWLAVDRAMDERRLAPHENASMYALRESVPSVSIDDTVTEVAANDSLLEIVPNTDWVWQGHALQSQDLEHLMIATRALDASVEKNRWQAMWEEGEAAKPPLASMYSTALRGSDGDPREGKARFLVDTFMSDATTANLLAEAFLHDATASQPIDLPKLNLAYAFARLAVALDTSPPDAGSDEAVQPTGGGILDTYGQVLDAIAEAMRDHGQESFILTLDRSSGEAWQRVIAAFEATLEHPLIDEESKARARQRVKTLTSAGPERNPAEDGN